MDNELLARAKAAQSPEELLKIARENGMPEFSEENAKMYFDWLHRSGELADEELNVSAGGCYSESNGWALIVTSGNLCSLRHSSSPWICRQCGGSSGKCTCFPSPSEFEDFWGVVTRPTTDNCGTCRYFTPDPKSGQHICENVLTLYTKK